MAIPSTDVIEYPELEPLAVEIEKLKCSLVGGVLDIGKLLCDARAKMARGRTGTFGRWCEERCGITDRSGRYMMCAWRMFMDNRKLVSEFFDDASIYLLAAPSCPVSAREFALEAAEKRGQRITKGYAKRLIENAKAAQSDGEETEEFAGCTVDDLNTLIRDGTKFGTIYADPPWAYGNQATRASTDNHYNTLSPEQIAAYPIADLAADKSHLHLWTTNGFLREAFDVIEAWGFEYKSCFVWVKSQMGIGNYWRVSHEFMLLGVRGGLTFDTSIMSWLEHKRTKHSAKPHAIRRIVEQVSPGPRLELFGREAVDSWTIWGNEISRSMFTESIPAVPA